MQSHPEGSNSSLHKPICLCAPPPGLGSRRRAAPSGWRSVRRHSLRPTLRAFSARTHQADLSPPKKKKKSRPPLHPARRPQGAALILISLNNWRPEIYSSFGGGGRAAGPRLGCTTRVFQPLDSAGPGTPRRGRMGWVCPPVSLGVSVSWSGCPGEWGGSARGCSREAETEGHPGSPRRRLCFTPHGVTRGHAGFRGNNSDSLDPGLLPPAAQAFPDERRGLFSYLANLWREAGGRDGRGGTASGVGGGGRRLKELPQAAARVMSALDENREGSPANPQLRRG